MWLSLVNTLGGSIVIGAWLVAARGGLPGVSAGQGAALAIFGVVQMAIPYALFARGLRDVTAPEAGLLSLIEPVLNPLWVLLFVGERPEWPTIVGGAFLLGGVLVRYAPAGVMRGGRGSDR
jgi:drug/metabolite transporter (DMT)-like permease